MFKGNKCYYVFFILLFLGFLSVLTFTVIEVTKKPSKCYNPAILEADELQIGNVKFSKEEFEKINETHFGICLEHRVPVLRKCCGENTILQLEGKNRSCVSEENIFEAILVIHDEKKITPLPNYSLKNFYRQYGMISCPGEKYRLNSAKESDHFIFFKDGTLLAPGENSNITETSDRFCLDVIKTETGPHLVAYVCFPDEKDTQWQLQLYPYGMIISMPFLFAVFLSHVLFKELRTLHGLYAMSHIASLLIFYIFLVISQMNGKGLNSVFCKICGFTVQFSFLAAFFWLNIMCAEMWWSIKDFPQRGESSTKKKKLKKFFLRCCYGWGGPGIILCISLIIDLYPGIPKNFPKPDVGNTMCLIDTDSNKLSALYYLYGPIGVLTASNLYFFISTMVKISILKKDTHGQLYGPDSRCNKKEKKRFTIYLKLFISMGITWLLELLSWAIGGPNYIWYIPDFSNSLQGLYIFMIYLPNVKEKVLKKYHQDQSRHNSNSTKSFSLGRSRKNSSYSASSSNPSKPNGKDSVELISVKHKTQN